MEKRKQALVSLLEVDLKTSISAETGRSIVAKGSSAGLLRYTLVNFIITATKLEIWPHGVILPKDLTGYISKTGYHGGLNGDNEKSEEESY